MKYAEAINYLYNSRMMGTKLGLSNTFWLLGRFEEAHKSFFPVHIAGTNGKGAVAAMVSSVLVRAGLKTGLFTSPHISSFRERIRIDGEMISVDSVARHLERMIPVMEEMKGRGDVTFPTFFEIVTVMAFNYFAEQKVDAAVIETGMGGRFDATNTCGAELAVITNVALEHTEYLGKSVKEIAFEKAGIINPTASVVLGKMDNAAMAVIESVAREKGARLIRLGEEIRLMRRQRDGLIQKVDIKGRRKTCHDLKIPLLGEHQAENAALAMGLLELIIEKGFAIDESAIYEGMYHISWPGRFEVVPGNPAVILDAACNPAGAERLRSTFMEFAGEGARVILVLGFLSDKDYGTMCQILVPLANAIVVTEPVSSRAASAGDVSKVVERYTKEAAVEVVTPLEAAVERARELGHGDNSYVCITGSNYLLGPARRALGLDDLAADFKLSDPL